MKNRVLNFFISIITISCILLSSCANDRDQENYQVTKEEYEAAFSMQALQNVTISMVGPYWERDHIKSYFYSEEENFALCSFSNDTQYYGRYYGVLDEKEFCYLYGNETLADFTQDQACWMKTDNPSAYSDKGVNFVSHYKRDFDLLEYNRETKSYDYESTAYGEKYVYSYYFNYKMLTKFVITYEADNYEYVCEFYDYGTTEIPVLVDFEKEKELENRALLTERYQASWGYENVVVSDYYGEFSGAIVAKVEGEDIPFGDVICAEKIADYTIIYPNENTIKVFYEDYFYSLRAAYDLHYLSDRDIETIALKNMQLYPELYDLRSKLPALGQEIEFNGKHESTYAWYGEEKYPSVQIISSYDEFCDYYTEQELSNTTYDEEFFENNYLVVVVESSPGGGRGHTAEKLYYYDGYYYVIAVDYPDSAGSDCCMGERHNFIELDNSVSITHSDEIKIVFQEWSDSL